MNTRVEGLPNMNARADARVPLESTVASESSASAVSWSAIFAGAAVAASASLLLVALGTGLGFAALSPWPNDGASASTLAVMTAIWLIVVQWVASGLGGYLTGRLRTKWVGTHTHEVFFRDTAHGFVTWAVATVVTAFVVGSAASSAISGGARAASSVVSGAAQVVAPAAAAGPASAGSSAGASPVEAASGYEIDSLFRSTSPNGVAPQARGEALRILMKGIGAGDLPPADRSYLAELVAARTGIPQSEAEQRVDNVIAQMKAAEAKARQAADTARKTAASTAIFTALSMLVGAFIASVAAALGGRQRDEHV